MKITYMYSSIDIYLLYGVYCARGEINKHIKPCDSFKPDKNMSRDTYLESLLLIFPTCLAPTDPLSISSFSFSLLRAIKYTRSGASLMTVLIMYNTISPATCAHRWQHLIMPSRELSRLYLRIATRCVRNRP